MSISEADITVYDSLAGDRCVCGGGKLRGCAFCATCYRSLPGSARGLLSRADGYAGRWSDAARQL